jgi:hypothetical protein
MLGVFAGVRWLGMRGGDVLVESLAVCVAMLYPPCSGASVADEVEMLRGFVLCA